MNWQATAKQNLLTEALIPIKDINLLADLFKNRLPNRLKGQIQNQVLNRVQDQVQNLQPGQVRNQVQDLRIQNQVLNRVPGQVRGHLLRDRARDHLHQGQVQDRHPAEGQHLVQVR